jgi:hypothetical protein
MIEIRNLRGKKPGQPWDVRVDRTSVLGNPFLTSRTDRNDACDKYEIWFSENIGKLRIELLRLNRIHAQYGQLTLFCWCAPRRCHAETIKRWLESYEESCLQCKQNTVE